MPPSPERPSAPGVHVRGVAQVTISPELSVAAHPDPEARGAPVKHPESEAIPASTPTKTVPTPSSPPPETHREPALPPPPPPPVEVVDRPPPPFPKPRAAPPSAPPAAQPPTPPGPGGARATGRGAPSPRVAPREPPSLPSGFVAPVRTTDRVTAPTRGAAEQPVVDQSLPTQRGAPSSPRLPQPPLPTMTAPAARLPPPPPAHPAPDARGSPTAPAAPLAPVAPEAPATPVAAVAPVAPTTTPPTPMVTAPLPEPSAPATPEPAPKRKGKRGPRTPRKFPVPVEPVVVTTVPEGALNPGAPPSLPSASAEPLGTEPPAPAKPRRRAVRKRKAPEVISATPARDPARGPRHRPDAGLSARGRAVSQGGRMTIPPPNALAQQRVTTGARGSTVCWAAA